MQARILLLWGQALLLVSAVAAHAAPVSFGTAEYVTIRSCIPGDTPCDAISAVVQGEFGGSPGAASSAAVTTLDGYGSADGSVALSGVVGAPVLRASATAEPGARNNTNSVALQRYTYTGTEAATRTFGGTLTYTQSLSEPYPDGVGNGIYAAIDIFTLPGETVEVGDTPESNFFALISHTAFDGYESLGSAGYDDDLSTDSGLGLLDVTVTLNPGDSVWVWVLLQTPAANGSVVDASSTLITGWNDATNLVPAALAVPEPASVLLVALAVLALLAQRQLQRAGVRWRWT